MENFDIFLIGDNMNRKNSLILFIIGLCLLVGGFTSSFFIGLKEDKQATRNRMVSVEDIYGTFSNQIDTFNDIRNDLYSSVFENVYYDTLEVQDPEIKKTFFQYEGVVDELGKVSSQLKDLCSGVYFPERGANTKCKEFSGIYEQIINAFVSDVSLYNKNINGFNQYQFDLGSPKKLENFRTNKKFIDYNQDGKFDGKEEE